MIERVKERWPDLPILILSGHGRLPNVVRAIRLGAANFVRKPFEVEELEEVLETIFRARSATLPCPTCRGSGRVAG